MSNESAAHRTNAVTVWLTGLSAAGKSTLARKVTEKLLERSIPVELLDGDILRSTLCAGLGFSKEDRMDNIRRIGYVCCLLNSHGIFTVVAAISPYREGRAALREKIPNYIEVHVSTPLHVCEARDYKGLYASARSGLISNFTGVDDPYEPPLNPEVVCPTHEEDMDTSVDRILQAIWKVAEL